MRLVSVILILLSVEISLANEAMESGRIGYSVNDLSHMDWFTPRDSRGGCKWYGTAPLCNGQCPDGYQQMRESNGRTSNWWMAGTAIPDDSFGHSCWTILGGFFKKRYCCIADPKDCSWTGTWQNTTSTSLYSCAFKAEGSRCGHLECSINTFLERGIYTVDISGHDCKDVKMFSTTGRATCGRIEWNEENDDWPSWSAHSWYKVR